ncbi:MAG: glycosyltransferase family 4 protein [Clostridia bacterium]|nr:glycosyltransferase family 4 protein [Clostridia bacterium]
MKKICIILPEEYPVPATKGGAVETLVNKIIDQNEIENKVKITCVARYEKDAYIKSKEYKNTKFIFFKMYPNKKIFRFAVRKINKLLLKITKINFKNRIHCKRLYNKIKTDEYDYILIEGGDPMGYRELLEHYDKEKRIIHFHGGNAVGTNGYDELFGKFIVLNNFMLNQFIENGIIKKERVYILKNGIDVSKFSKKIDENEKMVIREKYGIKQNDVIILFCGRLMQEKGVKELILALKELKNKENVKLLIVGSAEFGAKNKTKYEEELEEISKEIQNNIIFAGFIHNSEMNRIYQTADIAVVPSLWEDASPLVVVEEMASGLPIIATRSGGIPELVQTDGAILVERDSEIVENIAKNIEYLIENPDKRNEMSKAGKELSKDLSVKNFYKNFVQLFKNMN